MVVKVSDIIKAQEELKSLRDRHRKLKDLHLHLLKENVSTAGHVSFDLEFSETSAFTTDIPIDRGEVRDIADTLLRTTIQRIASMEHWFKQLGVSDHE